MNEEENSPNVAPAIRDFVVSMRAIEKAMAEEIRKSFNRQQLQCYMMLHDVTYSHMNPDTLEHMSAGMGPRVKIPGLKGAGGGLVL